MGRPREFCLGDSVLGRDEGPASFRGRRGVVQAFGGPGEYAVLFDDGRLEYVMSSWISRAQSEELSTARDVS
jgi:hypothetical protein